jgi:integrase/recombinase XerD
MVDGRVDVAAVEVDVAVVLDRYRAFLVDERGLAADSVRCYLLDARAFLTQLSGPVVPALAGLSAQDVAGFMLRYCRGRNTWSAKAMVTGLRSLLRYLHVAGLIPASLVGAVPTVAGWRGAGLPRGLQAAQVQAMVAGCDVGTVVGRRDRAVLLLLARLGLRTVEVARLGLDDVDWRVGAVAVRGKGDRVESLPLPVDVGEAVVAYLTGGRYRGDCRSLFVRIRNPHSALTAGSVRAIVARACARAGLPRLGAHRLRHTLATDLLRAGTPLAQVGQVLRHRSQLSTALYAKVDHAALRELARPWPGAR